MDLKKILNENNNQNLLMQINGFDFINKKEDSNKKIIWKYSKKQENYIFNLFITKNLNNNWYYKIFIYWKEQSKDFTSAKGKDFELQFGPFNNIDDLKKSLDKNNYISSENYFDNNRKQLDVEIFYLIDVLKDHLEDLNKSNNDFFKDLKKEIPYLFKNKEEVQEYLDKNWHDETDKQQLILIIQKMNRIKNLNQIDSIKSLF